MLYKYDNRASEFVMNICDNLLHVYKNCGFIMRKLHAYRSCQQFMHGKTIIVMIFGFKVLPVKA